MGRNLRALFAVIAILMMLPACRRQIPKTAWQQPEGFDPSGRSFKSHLRSVVYPYSVVAGGVESSGDVEEAVTRDPLVKDHYDDINVRHLEPVKLRHDTMAYVSFRKHGQIYWTSSKVSLPKGERVLSDGANCIRSRCGNRISWEPRGPVLENKSEEPTSGQLNTAEVRGQSLEEMPIPDVPMAPPFENWVIPNPVPVVLEGGVPVADAGAPGGGIIGGGGGGGGGGAAPMGPVGPNGAGPLLGVLLTPGQSTTSQTIVNGVTNVVNPVYIWPLNVTPPVATPTLIATLPPSSTPVPVLTPLTGPPAVSPPYVPPVTTPPGTPQDTPKPPPNTPPGTNPPDTPPPPGTPPPGDRPPATPPCDHPDQPGTPPVTPPAAVPEPSTIGMMVGGVALMLVFRRRRGL